MEAKKFWIVTSLTIVGTVYLVQTASPLRLDSDSVIYLYTGAQLADGLPSPSIDLPRGYAFIVAAADRIGLGSSFGLVLLNCLFLALGVYSGWRLLRIENFIGAEWLAVVTLFSVPVIHSIAIPLPEPAYFGISLLALLATRSAMDNSGSKRVWLLVGATLLTAIAISLRLTGIALVPALIVSLVPRRWILPMFAAAAVLGGLLSRLDAVSHSLHQARVYFSDAGSIAKLPHLIVTAIVGLGEVIVNLPYSRFHSLKPLFLIVGVVAAVAVFAGMRSRKKTSAVETYTLGYLAILVLWPYPTSRLWMPIIPLLLPYACSGVFAVASGLRSRRLLQTYGGWFVLTGSLALAYTTRLSVSPPAASAIESVTRTPDNGGAPLVSTTDSDFRSMERVVIERYGGRDTARTR